MPTPADGLNFMPFVVSVAYWAESAKYDSSAVTRLRRSDFMAAMYAFDFVLANLGIAIAARIPMITTTIRSSIRVKPFLFRIRSPEPVDDGEMLCRQHLQDGTFRGNATPVMAMSWPDSGTVISTCHCRT